VERDIPRLGTKHSQVGNETFPSWEKNEALLVARVVVVVGVSFETCAKKISHLSLNLSKPA